MDFLNFFVDFAIHGEVLGIGLGSRPEEWATVLGNEFFEGSHREGHLSREFGMIDVNFRGTRGDWSCYFIDLRVAQLQLGKEQVPEIIGAKYGEFPDRVAFEEVAGRLARDGVPLYKLKRPQEVVSLNQYFIGNGEVIFSFSPSIRSTIFRNCESATYSPSAEWPTS